MEMGLIEIVILGGDGWLKEICLLEKGWVLIDEMKCGFWVDVEEVVFVMCLGFDMDFLFYIVRLEKVVEVCVFDVWVEDICRFRV